jgi:hypothetical protein
MGQVFFLFVRPETLSAGGACLHEGAVNAAQGFGDGDFAGYVSDARSATALFVAAPTFLFHTTLYWDERVFASRVRASESLKTWYK